MTDDALTSCAPQRDGEHRVTAPSVRGAVDAFLHVPLSTADTPL